MRTRDFPSGNGGNRKSSGPLVALKRPLGSRTPTYPTQPSNPILWKQIAWCDQLVLFWLSIQFQRATFLLYRLAEKCTIGNAHMKLKNMECLWKISVQVLVFVRRSHSSLGKEAATVPHDGSFKLQQRAESATGIRIQRSMGSVSAFERACQSDLNGYADSSQMGSDGPPPINCNTREGSTNTFAAPLRDLRDCNWFLLFAKLLFQNSDRERSANSGAVSKHFTDLQKFRCSQSVFWSVWSPGAIVHHKMAVWKWQGHTLSCSNLWKHFQIEFFGTWVNFEFCRQSNTWEKGVWFP